MKLATRSVQVTSGGTAGSTETVPCGIDAGGIAHLMRTLSDLYKDSFAAILREYSVNALDSHRAAGNPAPVRVSLPSELNPVLVVADNGTGLSRDELISVYAPYGASTKRGSNEQTGAFGLGSKSAFTLGQQFVVTAVKDGERTVAAFGAGQDGAAAVTVLDHGACDDPSGVTVSIPVDDVQAVHRAAGPVFAGWEPGTVLVDGERPRSFLDDPSVIADGVYLADTGQKEDAAWGDAGLVIVMGGICYPVSGSLRNALLQRLPSSGQPASLFTRQPSRQRVFAVVGIGDVDIAPSREEMRDTPRTLDRLELVAAAYCEGIAATVRREIDSAPTLTAAVRAISAMQSSPHLRAELMRSPAREWRGRPIAVSMKVPYTACTYLPQEGKCMHEREEFQAYLGDPGLDQTLVITDVPGDRHETALRSARAFLAADDTYTRVVLTPPGAQPVEWFAFGRPGTLASMPLADYLAEARRRRPAGEKKPDGEPVQYTVYTRATAHFGDKDSRQMTAGEIAGLGLPVVAAENATALCEGGMRFTDFARAVHDGVAVVVLSGGRTLAALRRRLGDGVPVSTLGERADAVAARVAASYTSGDRELERVSACRQDSVSFSRDLLALRDRITSPAVSGLLDRMDRESRLTREDRRRAWLIAGARAQWPALFPPAEQAPDLLAAYPLLRGIQWRTGGGTWRDHVAVYLNAVG